ncbi:hypothetical protein G9G63_09140 [Paenibacillus sp. EKM202P]|uniref:hypothetical protein n=1 Tax=unclassified Paenibacillus TaxID=185978 RepID=UPI0013ECD0C1|nr:MULTISPECIES: hypothetical protein [unclassified Paenibacillus]KAF6565314.1 hypothetical protein G9G63_09140 [Paenibacillus sp. EKM202P]KAF6569360.1 hypothetical protein G9G64_12950 [Paenibacillus sp. EKM207P]
MTRFYQEEVEDIDRLYDEQIPLRIIADTVNEDFHDGKNVRNVKSISYAIYKFYNDGGDWFDRLPLKFDSRKIKNGVS